MTTHEPEITEPVDLCTPDGRRLAPGARGWSRRPLHRANLAGRWGRTKRWDYWAVQSEDVVLTVTFADIDYLGLVSVEWIDLRTHRTGGRVVPSPLARGVEVPELSAHGHLTHRSRALDASIRYERDATHLRAFWTERDGTGGSLEVEVAAPEGHESLNVVIPWSDDTFQFTSKHQARPARGTATIEGRTVEVGGAAGPAWGIYDAGRGRWPYQTRWNWGGGAGDSTDGRRVGIQVGGRWTEGTGATENGVLVDGRLEKIGEELRWDYRWEAPMEPWRVRSADEALDITLTPVHDRYGKTSIGVLHNEVHQVFGHWSGTVPDGAGGTLAVDRILGFAEESLSRW